MNANQFAEQMTAGHPDIVNQTTAGRAAPPTGNEIGREIDRQINDAKPGRIAPGSGIGRAEEITIDAAPASAIAAPIAGIAGDAIDRDAIARDAIDRDGIEAGRDRDITAIGGRIG